ncbi:MAG: amino acid ABC transporter permease [Proteobacteria bacterium]|nr:amino acid ABC transporter permease [Pseudomonadota bacterium]MBS0574648.1 amino acid ABC transporter permease [Pseudomonadota bacterium]
MKWLRENLFSGWLNSILTILGLLAIFFMVKGALPWLLHGVWDANSLGECRKIIAADWGQGQTGACWALIHERWNQFFFGFYPQEIYWRPTMTFFLMFPAITPVLFFGSRANARRVIGAASLVMAAALFGLGAPMAPFLVAVAAGLALFWLAEIAPAWLLWFTALYPGLTFWLLWGGPLWRPVCAMLGFVIMFAVFRLAAARIGATVAMVAGFLAACVWWLFLQTPVIASLASAMPLSLRPVTSDQFGGFLLAIIIGVTAIIGSLPLGIILALGRKSDMPLVKGLCVGFIEFVRGVPLITMLFTASLLLQYFLPPQVQFDLILRVIILVTLFSAAYIAEVIRGGLAALPRGQYEAADALGLDYWQAQRFIIMPQALKISIPGIVSSFIGLFKDTTLVTFVGLMDPLKGITQVVRADINWKGVYWEPYIFVGAIFFLFCFSMSRYSMYLERKLKRDHR